jgi:hypothetical protein
MCTFLFVNECWYNTRRQLNVPVVWITGNMSENYRGADKFLARTGKKKATATEAWSLTLREERRLRVFENRVLRRVFGPKRDEVIGE